MMNALILTHTLNTGGAERVGANIANGLADLGWDITVMANDRGKITYPLSEKVKLIWFDSKSKKGLAKRLSVFKQLRNFLNEEKPDIVIEILHVFPHELLLAKKFSNWNGSLVITEHDSYERPASAPMSKYLYYKKWILDKLFDHVTVLTEADKKFIGNRLSNVKVMYNPLFIDPLTEVPQKENIILSVGRLDAWHYKGFDVLINAWNRISQRFPNWKLKIIGDGKYETKQYLNSLAEGNNQIEFANYTTEITKEYKQAAIYCLSSRYEGWGLVMVEAMSQGCATIACDYHGRQSECIDNGVDGILSVPDDIDDLCNKLETLLDNPDLRDKIQKKALNKAKKYIIENVSKEWDSFLKSVIASKK